MTTPDHVYHADWGVRPEKRWLARATLDAKGRYWAFSPVLVGNLTGLVPSIQAANGSNGAALVGFDFPIGIPAHYASLVGTRDFKSFLRNLGSGVWEQFYNVARKESEISVRRPFYPHKPGYTRQEHLLKALGLRTMNELRRVCERKQPGRRAACPLFWTLGPNQVGKGAILGWQSVLAPALREIEPLSLWPFDGSLVDLLLPGAIVVVETYPTECYGWFFPRPLVGKGSLEVRRSVSGHLLAWGQAVGVEFDLALVRAISDGFPEGDDSFDAAIGLFGMLEVLSRRRQIHEPIENRIRSLEGWIFGQLGD